MGWSGSNYTRTDGTRTGSTVWTQARDASVKVNAADHDTHDQDIADGIDACLNKNGANSMTADLDMGGNDLTNTGSIDIVGGSGNDSLVVEALTGDGHIAKFQFEGVDMIEIENTGITQFNQAVNINSALFIDQQTAPSSASDTGTAGALRFDSNYMYYCVAANTWKRVALATW